jgi:CubicO group peptidase (beta-lactamase class C family)
MDAGAEKPHDTAPHPQARNRMGAAARVEGECEQRFAPLREVFAKSFETGEIGAAVAVTIAGSTVVDLWGGHRDAGGSIAFADPDARLGFAYTMNQMQTGLGGDARGFALMGALYAALKASR